MDHQTLHQYSGTFYTYIYIQITYYSYSCFYVHTYVCHIYIYTYMCIYIYMYTHSHSIIDPVKGHFVPSWKAKGPPTLQAIAAETRLLTSEPKPLSCTPLRVDS